MKEAFELIRKKLEEEIAWYETHGCDKTLKRGIVGATRKALSIVSEVEAEYGNGKTNADKIRSMSDEELAEYIFGVSEGSAPCVICSMDCDFCEATAEQCKEKTLNWLKSPTND